jgi:hypothetical protein
MSRIRKAWQVLTATTILSAWVSCTPGEGERCNPLRFTDECTNGTQCTYPKNCGVAYCCPAQVTPQSSPSCQACPTPDGGTSD